MMSEIPPNVPNPLFLKIENRAKQLGFKDITALCRESDVSRGALTDLKYSRTKELSVKTIAKLSPVLQVPVDFFTPLTDAGQQNSSIPKGTELLSRLPARLTDRQWEAVEFVLGLSNEQLEQFIRVGKAMKGE